MGFGEVMKVSGLAFYASMMSGIMGLAYDTISVDHLPTFMDNTKDLTEKSFSMYLHSNPNASYMIIPGMDTENWGVIETHKVVEERYWSLNLTGMKRGDMSIPTDGFKAVIDSGTSLLVGSTHIMDPLIEGIQIMADCSNVDQQPDITFTIDTTDYTLTPQDYVMKTTDKGESSCMMGI